ncbi:hypothetical protein Tco_0750518 [Tanacetum coccineum]|uniref:Uncharacterized protein n=1 Tax=Tanacetum coccineum TaxID=301880 RepID=A0ABQ4Z492_9ASTR
MSFLIFAAREARKNISEKYVFFNLVALGVIEPEARSTWTFLTSPWKNTLGLKKKKLEDVVKALIGNRLQMVRVIILMISIDFELEFPAIVFNDTSVPKPETPPKPTISSPIDKKLNFDFRISFDESDDEDYTFAYDKNSFSYKLVPVSNFKPDSFNDAQFNNLELSSNVDDIKTKNETVLKETPIEALNEKVAEAKVCFSLLNLRELVSRSEYDILGKHPYAVSTNFN